MSLASRFYQKAPTGGAGSPTSLSTGTVTSTTYGITSDGGVDDVVLAEATTSLAGLLSAAKWNEIVANTDKVTNATHTGDVTGSGALTIGSKKVTIGMLANGTDGELITWDAAGAAATVGAGTAKQVLTSNGAGAAPTMQSLPGNWYPVKLGNEVDDAVVGVRDTWVTPAAGKIHAVHGGSKSVAVGASCVVDVHKDGTTILTDKITIETGDKDSLDAATQPSLVSSPVSFAAGAFLEFENDSVPSSGCAGLTVNLLITWD